MEDELGSRSTAKEYKGPTVERERREYRGQ